MRDADHQAPRHQPTRRGVLRAATGLGLLTAAGLAAGRASASGLPAPLHRPETRLDRLRAGQAFFRTGPFQTPGLGTGARAALALLTPGGGPQAGGPAALVTAVESAALVAPGLGAFEPDDGVARGVRHLLAALSVPRPVGIHAFSAAAVSGEGLPSGLEAWVEWSARVRPGVPAQTLLDQLSGFHAWVLADLAPDGAFGDQLTFVRIRQAG